MGSDTPGPEITWAVEFTADAEDDLSRFRAAAGRLYRALARLERGPEAGEPLTGVLRGARSLKFSLPGTGECRAIYISLPAERVCLVFLVAPRENVYRLAERRFMRLPPRP